jgi:serine/threonine-protein kinase
VAQESLKVGQPVAIVLSAGPDTQTIPNVEGQAQAAAQSLLEGNPFKFVVSVTTEANDTVDVGDVIRTEPAVGGELATGSAITLIVSSGVEQVSVPPVAGLTEAQAKNLLTSKGLTATVTRVDVAAGDANDGRVIAQNPNSGTLVDPGSAVTIQVGRAVAPATTTTTTTTTLPPTTTSTTTTTTSTTLAP